MDGGIEKCYNQAAMEGAKNKPRKGAATGTKKRLSKPRRNGMKAAEVLEVLSKDYEPFPRGPRYDLVSEVVYTILSQHTSDQNSERAFQQLMDAFGSMEEVAKAEPDHIAQYINVGGLAKIKAPRIKQVLNLILEKRGSLDLYMLKDMPLDEAKAWLRELPGIGPKSAAVILCFALDMPAMAVDTHVFRVSKRLGLIGLKTSYEDAHEILEKSVKPEQIFGFHMSLITHGRRVCKAPRPLCDQCSVAYGCPSRDSWKKKKK